MNLEFLRGDVLLTVQKHLIETYGGLPGVRSHHALESAVARPHHAHHYTGEHRIAVLAALLAWAILRGHPFTDGNKRVALAALVIFADLNGHRLTCSEAEETSMVLRAAGSELTEDQWIAWARTVIVPR